MRVALDATPLTLSSGGLARYVSELHRALEAAFPEDEFPLVAAPSLARNFLERRWWLCGLNRELSRRRVDVFHGTNFEVPYVPLRASVLTLHDLSPWMETAWHHAADRVRSRAPLAIGLGLATMVVTPSQAVRRQAIERFRVSPQRVVAVPEAAAPHLRPAEAPRAAPYFLFLGTLEPRKNLPLLVEAWRAARREVAVDLVLAGRRRADFPALTPEPGLTILGEVAEDRLSAWYSGALAFVYPSLYEGFGLPVLEAMQCGAAVITSRDAAISEVAAGVAEQVDARDGQAWKEALLAAATRPEWVAGLRAKSLQRARDFSWERTARLTREVYEEALRRFA
ncbi:MAG: glycosyltransferase family 1 protein [Bryobacteraceae bacterium]|jgi:glycosyltransferase involved in cell wall biosynthesis